MARNFRVYFIFLFRKTILVIYKVDNSSFHVPRHKLFIKMCPTSHSRHASYSLIIWACIQRLTHGALTQYNRRQVDQDSSRLTSLELSRSNCNYLVFRCHCPYLEMSTIGLSVWTCLDTEIKFAYHVLMSQIKEKHERCPMINMPQGNTFSVSCFDADNIFF